jgi:class 3 adenylate cyclase
VGWVAAETVGHRVSADPFVLRQTAVLELEAGTWRIVQWHVSRESPSVEVFGLELSGSLGELVSHLGDNDASTALDSPSDTVTVMFTDIKDSTHISQEFGDDQWRELIANHFSLLARITENNGGTLVKKLGDGTMTVFKSARAAIDAAVEIQRGLTKSAVKVRIGIHTGDSVRQQGDYYGVAVNKAARIAAIAEGGDIVVSAVSAELSGGQAFRFGPERTVSLKGLKGTHAVYNVDFS